MIFNTMNLSDRISELTRVLRSFSAAPAPAAAPLAFSDYKLEDGTMIRVDGELAVGTLVYVVTEEGLLPAPDGAHSIPEVGVVTTEGGKIVEIGDAAPAPAPEAVEAQEVEIEVTPEGDEMPADPHEERMQAMEAAIAALAAKVEEIMAKMGGEVEANAARFSTIDTALSALAQMPTAAPKKRASDAVVESVKMSRASRLAEVQETLKTLKK
jgi:hypothetical protein